jgi:serine protease Do
MDQLIDHGAVVRGYLGVFIADLSEELAKSFGYQGKGVLIQDLEPGGPAAKAGVKPGDIVIERDGKSVEDASTFRNAIAQTPPGAKVALRVFREGKAVALSVKLGELPGEGGGPTPAHKGKAPELGVELSDITPELRQRLQLADARGAVVTGVQPGSPAAEAGLRAGDVLLQVGEGQVRDAAAAKQLLAKTDAKRPLRVRILRDGRGVFLVIPPRK